MKIEVGRTYRFLNEHIHPAELADRTVTKIENGSVTFVREWGAEFTIDQYMFEEEYRLHGVKEPVVETPLKSQFEMVKEFQQAFGHPVAEVPASLDDANDRSDEFWNVTEKHIIESKRLLQYMQGSCEKGIGGPRHFRARLMLEELVEFMEAEDLVCQTDAMLDLLYFVNGTLVEMGVDPEKPFAMVHAANMRKLWPDGKPRWNAEGKIMKPDGWVGPEDELRHYIESLEQA